MIVRTGDLNEGNLVDKCGGVALDFVIISYVLIYCTNDRTADMLAKLLAVASPQRRSFCLNPSTLRSIDVPSTLGPECDFAACGGCTFGLMFCGVVVAGRRACGADLGAEPGERDGQPHDPSRHRRHQAHEPGPYPLS